MTGHLGTPRRAPDDNWLTVNVWTPDLDPAARRPVMVWIYGGAYRFGSGGVDPRRIAHDGSLVVVTFNYREGVEGFAQIAGAPANRGLLDQIAVLEWVQENIEAFGGDPDQVTIFGESAGAGCVAALLATPRATGLFRRAIVQSLPGSFFTDESCPRHRCRDRRRSGPEPDRSRSVQRRPVRAPRGRRAVASTMRQHETRWGQAAFAKRLFAPVIDGELLPTTPWKALAAGKARQVDLIAGHNRDEYRLFMAVAGQIGKISDDQAALALREFAPGPDGERAYREAFPQASPEMLYQLLRSDWEYRMPTLKLAEAQVAGGGSAHIYELTWPAPANGGVLGACHGLDVALLFGSSDPMLRCSFYLGSEPSPEAEALGNRFRAAWTAFAATGDPGWPPYDPERRLVQVLDVPALVASYPEEASRRIWQDHEFERAAPVHPLACPRSSA